MIEAIEIDACKKYYTLPSSSEPKIYLGYLLLNLDTSLDLKNSGDDNMFLSLKEMTGTGHLFFIICAINR